MDVVVKIKDREALPVWTLPYVTSWRLSPDMLLERLAGDAMYIGEKFPIAFNLARDKTPASILPAQWHELNNLIVKLEQDLTDKNLSRFEDRKAWKKETIEEFWEDEPAYVWLNEFLQWYEGFINSYWISGENENTALCFKPRLPNSHVEYFEKHEKTRVNEVDIDFKAIPLDAVDKEGVISNVLEKGVDKINPLSGFKEMDELTWEEVSIHFTTTEDVIIKARTVTKRVKFNDFYTGIDTRDSSPTSVWEHLRMLAIVNQKLIAKESLYKNISDVKTAIKRVRKMLKESFDIESSPIKNKTYEPIVNLSIEDHVIKHLYNNTLPSDNDNSDIEEVMKNEPY